MLAHQVRRGRLHGRRVERAEHPADAPRLDAGAHRRLEQHVRIAARLGAVARMEGVGHRLRPLHGDVRRQEGVGAAHPGEGAAFDLGVEVHHLHEAVHAGVGAACAEGGDGFVSEGLEGRLQLVLHRLARSLALPAFVMPAVVANAEGQPHR
ncbi:hypothetical protein FQZ97_1040500 [compost metagenome]